MKNPNPALLCLGTMLLLLAGCSVRPPAIPGFPEASDSAPRRVMDPSTIADATPRQEPRSRYGNPASYVVRGKRYQVMSSSRGYMERGVASWYGTKFHGRRTSSGEPYDMYKMTAAHKSLPLPTYVEVRNLSNGRTAVLKVNDRGPFHENRIIDLSYAAATKLGILAKGTGLVEVRALEPGQPTPRRQIAAPPRPRPTSGTEPGIFIQVGAFSSQGNADRLRSRLSGELNRNIRIQRTQRYGQPLFRVQVGPLAGVEQADALSVRLSQLGHGESRIIIE
ncbi:MAG: septal ring lytic transglycosylase RlpA family protein [Candidatus Sedimenticola sp. 20ELBAFRAG]